MKKMIRGIVAICLSLCCDIFVIVAPVVAIRQICFEEEALSILGIVIPILWVLIAVIFICAKIGYMRRFVKKEKFFSRMWNYYTYGFWN